MHMSFVPDTQNKEFQDALNLIQYTRQFCFPEGESGYGKSTFLRYICEHTKKKHVVLAPTGIAAINGGGKHAAQFLQTDRLSSRCPMTQFQLTTGTPSTNS